MLFSSLNTRAFSCCNNNISSANSVVFKWFSHWFLVTLILMLALLIRGFSNTNITIRNTIWHTVFSPVFLLLRHSSVSLSWFWCLLYPLKSVGYRRFCLGFVSGLYWCTDFWLPCFYLFQPHLYPLFCDRNNTIFQVIFLGFFLFQMNVIMITE